MRFEELGAKQDEVLIVKNSSNCHSERSEESGRQCEKVSIEKMRSYYVYILSSTNKVLYVGVTNNLERRIYEHKNKLIDGFTAKYNVNKLVYYEETTDVNVALNREKEIKGWSRSKKISLIERNNFAWDDLSLGFQILCVN